MNDSQGKAPKSTDREVIQRVRDNGCEALKAVHVESLLKNVRGEKRQPVMSSCEQRQVSRLRIAGENMP